MTAQDRLSALMQFAQQDVLTLRQEGAMSITDTLFGPIHMSVKADGSLEANVPKYGWNVSGQDDEIVKFLTQVYRIIEE